MNQNTLQTIALVISRLNAITISGRENMMNLLGSIGALEDVYNELSSQTKEAQKEE